MTVDPLTLRIDPEVGATLARFLAAALEMRDGVQTIDYLPINPYGDLAAYMRQVSVPLRDEVSHDGATGPNAVTVAIPLDELEPLRMVLDGFGEAVAGGVPWVAVTGEERLAVAALLAQLGTP